MSFPVVSPDHESHKFDRSKACDIDRGHPVNVRAYKCRVHGFTDVSCSLAILQARLEEDAELLGWAASRGVSLGIAHAGTAPVYLARMAQKDLEVEGPTVTQAIRALRRQFERSLKERSK